MTWCTRIYDILNGWSEEENQFSIANNNEEDKPKVKQLSAEFFKDETLDNNKTIIQHDSPFLEKSDSFPTTHLTTKQLYNDDYLNGRDYQGEHICVDTHFSCHQRDGQYYYDAEDRPYGIATISNMSLNLPKYFGDTENIQQQLSRSFSLDLPMDIRRNAYTIPSFSDISPHVRYSTTQQINQAFNNKEKPNRLSLNLGSRHNSQFSLEQRQTTEEEFFNNQTHNRSFDEFLDIIASKVSLKNFKGYRGGLDVSEQTDSPVSYYEFYDQKEIMFHVSTLLPYTNNDTTQIQRKRHIGNDIVAIVFQEENTPFHPSMIKSNFLHAFLVIQPAQILSRPCYKIMFIAREDIQEFPPNLQKNVVYIRTAEQLKPFILSKLINAEYAAYRCRTFALLQERTRCSFLKNLCENLSDKSFETLCDEQKHPSHRRSTILSNSTRKRYLSSMKKIFSRSNSTPDGPRQSIKSDQIKIKPSKKLVRLGKSMDSADGRQHSLNASSPIHEDISRENKLINRHMNARSDDSLNSSGDITTSTMQNYSSNSQQMYHGDESDEGLDSMSSADAARLPYDSDDQDAYRQQIREKSHPSQIWHRVSTQRHIYTPQTAGIHISEEATV
ncbi:unnamed protein product [Rotaria magnacalcarata]|uniref:Rap-GAP domain-containing protein n=1 Tax=Rotaria magnacalcarata TaxID=392030 RepID=A0A819M7S0_9BILA|nr:unnamed protein product [Rotaria magnacalcarata]